MRAAGYVRQDSAAAAAGLRDLVLPRPPCQPADLLVRVLAVSVNPLDVKMAGVLAASPERPRIMGWDAAGTVAAVGSEVEGFVVGDEVYYMGDIRRPGSNAEFQAVDHRLVAHKPRSLDFAEAAALPLASLTAWEMLFDRMRIAPAAAGARLLVLGGAGGVGSMAVQLARQKTDATVIGSASRPESAAWLRRMGAHHVVSHAAALAPQLQALGQLPIRHTFSMHSSAEVWPSLIEVAEPWGDIGFVDDAAPLQLSRLRAKSLALHAAGVFNRVLQGGQACRRHGAILATLAAMVDAGAIRSPLAQRAGPLDAAHLRDAHARIASGHSIGKLVLESLR